MLEVSTNIHCHVHERVLCFYRRVKLAKYNSVTIRASYSKSYS